MTGSDDEGDVQSAFTWFWTDESGAVTVDWIVLTAATVGIGTAVMGKVSDGIEDLSTDISDFLSRDLIHTGFGYHPVMNPDAPNPDAESNDDP